MKKLKSVCLHQSLFWPSVPGADSTTINETKSKGIVMWIDDGFLFLSYKDKIAMTPITNIRTAEPLIEQPTFPVEIEEPKKRGRPFKTDT